jgi:hypothetical protein
MKTPLRLVAGALCAVFAVPAARAAEEPITDLRGLTIGEMASDLPVSAYHNLVCLAGSGQSLASWDDWKSCPAGADGLRAAHVEYNQPGQDATMVAGHPVDLTLFFDGDGRVVRIEITTQEHTSLFLRKKAYLLQRQAMQHFGGDGWTCHDTPPDSSTQEAIGPLFINQTCSKADGIRAIDASSLFFHKVGGAPKDFVSESRVVINYRPPAAK